MVHENAEILRRYFLNCLEKAMQILSEYDHITNFLDLPVDIDNRSIELSKKMDEICSQIDGLTIAEYEKYYYFQRWYLRLELAGLVIEDQKICADCIPENVWDQIDEFDDDEIISRRQGSEFICSKCGRNRGR